MEPSGHFFWPKEWKIRLNYDVIEYEISPNQTYSMFRMTKFGAVDVN